MFNFHDFIFAGIKDAIGKQPDYWVILNAASWAEKGVLTQDDLAEVSALITAKNTPPVVDNENGNMLTNVV